MDIQKHSFHLPLLPAAMKRGIQFLCNTQRLPLPPSENFNGAGVYAIYYHGKHHLYSSICLKTCRNMEIPIYVGKAVPPGWRQGRIKSGANTTLKRRLSEHAKSINQGADLDLADFSCKFVILDEEMLPLIAPLESNLVACFKPLWNSCIDGFGNHDPGKGRYNQLNSEWDTLHPGRPWEPKMPPNPLSKDEIIARGRRYLSGISS